MNKKNKNYLYSILGVPKQLLGKHLGKEQPQEKKHTFTEEEITDLYNGGRSILEQQGKSPLKVGKGDGL